MDYLLNAELLAELSPLHKKVDVLNLIINGLPSKLNNRIIYSV